MVRNVLRRWQPLSALAVLVVLAVAVVAGTVRPAVDAAGSAARLPAPRVAEPVAPVAPPAPVQVAPAPRPTPVVVSRSVASRGSLSYAAVAADGAGADVPARALAAYQRAATVIGMADKRCHLDWPTLAAIGKVASDHGRADRVGPRLDGRRDTAKVVDTDAGQVDVDRRFDRTVGPMRMLPATWSVVSVDGDSDGRRDPQDLDDSALGVAVLLCAGRGDLREHERLRDQVGRYHAGEEFVRAVLTARRAYVDAAAAVAPTPVLTREPLVLPSELPTGAPEPRPEDSGATFEAPGGQSFAPGPGSDHGPRPSPEPPPRPAPTRDPVPDPTPAPAPAPSPTPSPTSTP